MDDRLVRGEPGQGSVRGGEECFGVGVTREPPIEAGIDQGARDGQDGGAARDPALLDRSGITDA